MKLREIKDSAQGARIFCAGGARPLTEMMTIIDDLCDGETHARIFVSDKQSRPMVEVGTTCET